MKSMTGYGRGRSGLAGNELTVEISSVNRKQIEISFGLPRSLSELEPRLRDEIGSHISRGRLSVSVALHGKNGKSKARVNVAAAAAYAKELAALKKKLKLAGEVRLEDVLRGPEVLSEPNSVLDPEAVWPALRKALDEALRQMNKMRQSEGNALGKDLTHRLKVITNNLHKIKQRAPQVMEQHRKLLLERAEKADIHISDRDERLLKEIVFFADRSDISEEITRLQSHLKQFEQTLRKNEPVGRTLDFMIVEMNREVNTIGSKANDLEISRIVVDLKTELEKIREQAQNIE